MVVFTCSNCGESLQKPRVAKHYMGRCRGPPNVSCVDCFKDFHGNEYEGHTKCITEEERYSAKGFVPKPSSNKGEKKQQSWCEAIQSILDSDRNIRPDERQLLQFVSAYENVPRKKGKFINFLSNAHKTFGKNQDLIERSWAIIEEFGKANSGAEQSKSETNGDSNQNGNNPDEPMETEETSSPPKSDKKKRKKEKDVNEENGTEHSVVVEDNEDATQNSKKKKKKSESENGIDESEPAAKKMKIAMEENTNGLEKNKETKKGKKRKATESESESKGLLHEMVEQAGGSTTLYKFLRLLEDQCKKEGGVEKAEKKLKKLQKQMTISLQGDAVTLQMLSV